MMAEKFVCNLGTLSFSVGYCKMDNKNGYSYFANQDKHHTLDNTRYVVNVQHKGSHHDVKLFLL